jgi:hypothetical protein
MNACTDTGWTQLNTRGENAAAQEGTATLIDAAETTGQTAISQGDLVGGIALPALMHIDGATVTGQASSARQCWAEVELGEPALQGPRAGQLNVGELFSGKMLGEDDADKFNAPVRMVSTQGLSLKENGIVGQALPGGRWATVSSSGHGVVVAASLE